MKNQSYLSNYTQHELSAIVDAIESAVCYFSVDNGRGASCGILRKEISVGILDCPEARLYTNNILKEYRRVCRARDSNLGFRDYPLEEWCYFDRFKKQKIRIRKLNKFKDHVEKMCLAKNQEIINERDFDK